MEYYFYILIGFLAIVVFFVILVRTKSRKEEMKREDEWMQSLPQSEWGAKDEKEDEEKDNR